MGANRPTIRDVAAQAGVSVQTVSRVLNAKPDVAATTRARVKEAIAETGYEPNFAAQGLVTRRSHLLGFITTGLVQVGLSEPLIGVAAACEDKGFDLLVTSIPASAEALAEALRLFSRRGVEGVVVQVPQIGIGEVLADLGPRAVPTVVLRSAAEGAASLRVDNEGGARSVAEHLIGLGRRRIGHLDARSTEWTEAAERYAGWQRTLTDAGLAATDDMTAAGDWSSASGAEAFERLLTQCPDLDAVFAANDQMALGAMAACARRGIRIPDDIAIAGFDDLPDAAFFSPPLTTVAQPLAELGQAAAASLFEAIDRGSPADSDEVLATELVVRQSTVSDG